VKLREKYNPITKSEEYILESIFAGIVPVEYLGFMQFSNGGKPDASNCLFKYRKYNGRYSAWALSKILSVKEICNALEAMSGMLNTDYIPFAVVANGDPIVMSRHSATNGFIYLYDGDEMDNDNIPKTILGKSFNEFMGKLVDIDLLERIVLEGESCN
jgi:hypothetical protein